MRLLVSIFLMIIILKLLAIKNYIIIIVWLIRFKLVLELDFFNFFLFFLIIIINY